MEKRTDDNKSNGINPFSDNAVLREPSCPFTGKDARRAERGSYKMAYPDRVAILKENARKNRIGQTDAEKVLWEYLRRNALGVRFRRQFIIGDFIVDFACLEKKLVVEVDGLYHFTDEQIEEDRKRTYHISQLGFRVIRFTNEEIMTDINKVITNIKKNLYEQ
jgi:very-short-patch-repair endonuclease